MWGAAQLHRERLLQHGGCQCPRGCCTVPGQDAVTRGVHGCMAHTGMGLKQGWGTLVKGLI